MKPVRLQMVGLRSWKTERELKFDGIDLAAVIGPTGAGKSSILEAIVYALYNASTYDRRGVGSLISSGGKTMSVTLDFDANGERWRATRSTSQNNYPPSVHKLTCLTNPAEHPPVEGERAVNAAIEALIGLDLDQFLTAVLLPQGRFQTLLMATAGERAGILKGVFRLDELDEIRERAATVRRDQVEPILEAKRTERSQLLPDPEATLVEATAEVDCCTETVDELADIKKQYDGFVGRASELDAAAKQARQHADALAAAVNAIPSFEDAVELHADIIKREEEIRAARTDHVTKRDQAQAKLDDAAGAGVTVRSLATACQILETAQNTLPALDLDEQTLQKAADALEGQKRTLDENTRQHAEQVQQLAGGSDNVRSLKTSAEQASTKLSEDADALRALRTAEDHASGSRREVAEHEQQLTAATTAANTAKAQAMADKAAADGAEAVLEAVRKEHQAAHLAADLHAGEPCPVCQRELPDGFAPPDAPTALQAAEGEARRLRKAADDSAAATSKAAANVDTLGERLTRLREASELANDKAAQARASAEASLGPIDLTHDDVELLASVRGEAAAAMTAYEEANRELATVTGRLDAATESLRQRAQAVSEREQELTSEAERIKREREAQSTALSGLPQEHKPEANTPEVLAATAECCSSRLTELQKLHESVRTANAQIEAVDADIAALARERTEKIDGPRREATGDTREIAAKVRELKSSAKLPKQPADSAAIADHASWVTDVVALALGVAESLRSKASQDEIASNGAKKAAEGAIQAASELVEVEIATAPALDGQLNARRARLLAAEKERDKAVDQIPKAAVLDTQIERLRSRRESLEEVTRLLGDGHFIKWLVERRQQLLLVVASEIFAGMTGGRYRFASDFTVIDGRTGIARNPRTLSGGESFMASLALALGMAELAARSGGRIGSLYLDEGFGALDPNVLDEAITALELRAGSGQMILIVSHVPAVAQRIERVLEVRPDPTGSSAAWLDDEDRESLLSEAATAEA